MLGVLHDSGGGRLVITCQILLGNPVALHVSGTPGLYRDFFSWTRARGGRKKKDNSQAIVGEVKDGLKRQSMG